MAQPADPRTVVEETRTEAGHVCRVVDGARSSIRSFDVSQSEPQVEVETPPEDLEGLAEMPLPSDPNTFFLGGLFALAILKAAYVAGEIVLPLAFAITLNLLMQPVLRILHQLHVPKALAALLLILVVFATIVGLGAAISGPAGAWMAKLPEGIPRLRERLSFLDAPIDTLQTLLKSINGFGAVGPSRATAGALDGGALLTSLFAGTRSFASGLFTTVLFLYFLLVSSDSFLRRFVEILPSFRNKRQAVEISLQIQSDISAYLVTITAMNALVGVATGLVMWSTGVGDPVLWGNVPRAHEHPRKSNAFERGGVSLAAIERLAQLAEALSVAVSPVGQERHTRSIARSRAWPDRQQTQNVTGDGARNDAATFSCPLPCDRMQPPREKGGRPKAARV
jgi:AI-2E family transporter